VVTWQKVQTVISPAADPGALRRGLQDRALQDPDNPATRDVNPDGSVRDALGVLLSPRDYYLRRPSSARWRAHHRADVEKFRFPGP